MTIASIAFLNLTLCVIAWAAFIRFRRGPALSPFSITLLLLGAIFGVRPLIIEAEGGQWWLYGIDVSNGVRLAAIVGLWAILALIAGYAFSFSRKRRVQISLGLAGKAPSVRLAALISLACSAAWFVSMAIIGGGFQFLQQLAAGRSAEIASRLEGVPVFFSAIPVAGVVAVSVARAYREREAKLPIREAVLFWLAIAAGSLPPLALGNRRLLIPVALCALIVVLRRRWEKRITLAAAAIVAAGALVVAALPFVRSAGSRTASGNLVDSLVAFFEENGVGETVRSFFVSYDTEMFSYIALLGPRLGDGIPYGAGRGTLGELILQPIPASIAPWPTWSNSLLTDVFGGGCATVACPVPSVVGILFFDLGLIGVLLGMFCVGLVIAAVERALVHADGFRLAAALTVAGFAPGLIRGNTVSQLWIVLNVLLVAFAVLWVMAPRSRSRARGFAAGKDASGLRS